MPGSAQTFLVRKIFGLDWCRMVFSVTSIKSLKRKRLLYGTHVPTLPIASFDSENLRLFSCALCLLFFWVCLRRWWFFNMFYHLNGISNMHNAVEENSLHLSGTPACSLLSHQGVSLGQNRPCCLLSKIPANFLCRKVKITFHKHTWADLCQLEAYKRIFQKHVWQWIWCDSMTGGAFWELDLSR